MSPSIVPPTLPTRPEDSHKGTFGRVLIVAGSREMPGAAVLAANGALRGGAGLVTVATAASAVSSMAPAAPCATYIPLAESEAGFVAATAFDAILSRAEGVEAVILGPGLGSERGTTGLVRRLVAAIEAPLILDADGLNALANEPQSLLIRSFPTVLTPHPGELFRFERGEHQALPRGAGERTARAAAAAKRFRAVVCLKGHETVVTDGEATYVNDTGNPAMATGGTGDVLAGVVGALVAQLAGHDRNALDATVAAVRIHGLAGDLATEIHGPVSVIATDLLDHMGAAFVRYGVE